MDGNFESISFCNIVFIVGNLRTPDKLSVVALMNRLCGDGFSVTAITDEKCSKSDYRYDSRINRLSCEYGVDGCVTREKTVDAFLSSLPKSVVILDAHSANFIGDVALCRMHGHKVVCIDNCPTTTDNRLVYVDAAVTNLGKTEGHIYIPYYYPFSANENTDSLFDSICKSVGDTLSDKLKKDISYMLTEGYSDIAYDAWTKLLSDVFASPSSSPVPEFSFRRAGLRERLAYSENKKRRQYTLIQLSSDDVRRSQLLALKMLFELERICCKYSLRYYVAAGSLLGAVRHKGQIPWDDDIDVTMPRRDYERFIEVAQTELPSSMTLPKNNYPYGFHRIQTVGTCIEREVRQKCSHGIFLDIFPLDGAAPNGFKRKLHGIINKYLMLFMFETARPQPGLSHPYEGLRHFIVAHFCSKKLLYRLWNRNAKKYDSDSADFLVCLPGIYGYEKECFPRDYWGEPCMLEYEGRLCPVMHEWEKYLTLHYGEYMRQPPALLQRTHFLYSIDFGKYNDVSIDELEGEVFHEQQKDIRSDTCRRLGDKNEFSHA